jgi:hypothetical protein
MPASNDDAHGLGCLPARRLSAAAATLLPPGPRSAGSLRPSPTACVTCSIRLLWELASAISVTNDDGFWKFDTTSIHRLPALTSFARLPPCPLLSAISA